MSWPKLRLQDCSEGSKSINGNGPYSSFVECQTGPLQLQAILTEDQDGGGGGTVDSGGGGSSYIGGVLNGVTTSGVNEGHGRIEIVPHSGSLLQD